MVRVHPPAGRGPIRCLAAGMLVLSLGAAGCGRRGPLEPPDAAAGSPPAVVSSGKPVPSDRRLRPATTANRTETVAPATTLATGQGDVVRNGPDDETDEDDATQAVSPSPTPRKRVRAFVVPKEPFVLDPLL